MNEYAAPHADVRGDQPDADERQWGMIAHLSLLAFYLGGIGLLIGPIVVWMMKKNESEFVDECGKEAVNFALSCLIWLVASIVMFFTLVLAPVAIAIWIFGGLFVTIVSVVAGIKANSGVLYRYPLTLRLIS